MTRILRHEGWNTIATEPEFTLLGQNSVQGINFRDEHHYRPGERFDPILQLGRTYYRVDPRDPHSLKSVDDVVITNNIFSGVHPAIKDGGLPISRLFVTHNEFGGYDANLELAGDQYNMVYPFRVDDSVVAYNTFKPGSFMDKAARQGVLASEIGASYHLDFSHNTADGASPDFLYSPDDPKGWRAAFFWHMNNNHEMMLVSQNKATCTGDKIGDGEGIAFDNNANTFAFEKARTVLGVTADSVTVAGPMANRQNNRDIPMDHYYVG
ncbi:MAG: hypothetical protein ACREJM_05325, partial [Candidatus Saccharimonadales bacterium]